LRRVIVLVVVTFSIANEGNVPAFRRNVVLAIDLLALATSNRELTTAI
jgi:hypothetical protein